jgi:ribosome-associated protein
MIQVTRTIAIDERDLDERFVRASGPGGQHVNKVATAVELRFDIARAALPDDVKARLRALGGGRVADDDVLIIDSREHRAQGRNREAARERLVALVRAAARRPRRRIATAPSAGARERRIAAKKLRGQVKAGRGRPGDDDATRR